jgi:hypothetical protein
VVDCHSALSQEFFDVAVGQTEAQVPADGQHDHIGAGRRSPRRLTVRSVQDEAGKCSSLQSDRSKAYSLTNATVLWDDTTHAWRTEPGTFDLHVGPSSGDLPLHTAIEIPGS